MAGFFEMTFDDAGDPVKIGNEFHVACMNGDTQKAIRLLDENPDNHHLINTTRSDFPAILVAAYGKHWDLCAELMRRDVEMNVKNRSGYSPIHVFAENGQDELIKMANECVVLIGRKDNRGRSALYFAVQNNMITSAELLIELGCEVNTFTINQDTPMHCAARAGNLPMAQMLIDKGAYCHIENDEGETPSSLATDAGMRSLLEQAALLTVVKEADDKRKASEPASASQPAADAPAASDAAASTPPAAPKRRILRA